jgi:hypothetical protein
MSISRLRGPLRFYVDLFAGGLLFGRFEGFVFSIRIMNNSQNTLYNSTVLTAL